MAILALDLASQTGWAVYAKGMDRPHFGSIKAKRASGSYGEAGKRLWAQLDKLANLYGGFTDIAFEAQHISVVDDKRGNKVPMNAQAMYLLIGMGFLVETFAANETPIARCFSVEIGTWRSHFLGKGSFKNIRNELGKVLVTGRQQAKQRTIDVCNDFGWYPPDDNAADACGILDYYLSILPSMKGHVLPWRDATFMAGVRRS